jgi:hypothetical protein
MPTKTVLAEDDTGILLLTGSEDTTLPIGGTDLTMSPGDGTEMIMIEKDTAQAHRDVRKRRNIAKVGQGIRPVTLISPIVIAARSVSGQRQGGTSTPNIAYTVIPTS